MADKFEASTNAVKEVQDQELLDFTARKLVEMAADIIMCHLLIQDASKSSELFSKSAHVYLNYAEAEVEKHSNFIENFDKEDLAFYKSNKYSINLIKASLLREWMLFYLSHSIIFHYYSIHLSVR